MKRHLLRISAVLVIAAFVAVIFLVLPQRSRRGVTYEQYNLLQPGMTEAEAERLLYGPPRNDLRYAAIVWLPQANGPAISAEVAPTTPAVDFFSREDRPKNGRQQPRAISTLDFFPRQSSKDGHQSVWITRTGLIAVYFGNDGRLEHKFTSRVYEPTPPTLLGRVALRPR
jgi:hypothetical protein